tara:strand:- start:359 stop:835 length:477 start_codon:yes stop_codon:yes gene_type:complete
MNIFVLNTHPEKAAKMQHNKHVVKMVLESTQMLCSAFDPKHNPPYKKAYINHPCTVWARTSKENYEWLLLHALSLAIEYTYRYNKEHASEKVIGWCWNNYETLIDFPKQGKTTRPLAMPDIYKTDDVVESYINYYIGEKLTNAQWTRRQTPEIFQEYI